MFREWSSLAWARTGACATGNGRRGTTGRRPARRGPRRGAVRGSRRGRAASPDSRVGQRVEQRRRSDARLQAGATYAGHRTQKRRPARKRPEAGCCPFTRVTHDRRGGEEETAKERELRLQVAMLTRERDAARRAACSHTQPQATGQVRDPEEFRDFMAEATGCTAGAAAAAGARRGLHGAAVTGGGGHDRRKDKACEDTRKSGRHQQRIDGV